MSSKPDGSLSSLVNVKTETPYLVPDKSGNYTIALSVYDGTTTSEDNRSQIKAKQFNDTEDDVNYNLIDDLVTNYLTVYSFQDMLSLAEG